MARINPATDEVEGWLPQATVTDEYAFPKRGSRNYDMFVSNTYDAWQRGDLTTSDINRMPMDIRNNVFAEQNKRAVQEKLNEVGIALAPYVMSLVQPGSINGLLSLAGG